jgi:hypothetical protein
MIDGRFQFSEFENKRDGKAACRALADLLAEEIAQELSHILVPAMSAIVEKLNRLGHNLQPYGTDELGHITFRDDEEDEAGYDCKLRVGYDLVISTGYRDVRYSKSNPQGLYPEDVR